MGPGRREICVGICTGPNIRVHIPRNTPVGAFPTGDDYTRLQTVESLTFFLKRDVFLTYKKVRKTSHLTIDNPYRRCSGSIGEMKQGKIERAAEKLGVCPRAAEMYVRVPVLRD